MELLPQDITLLSAFPLIIPRMPCKPYPAGFCLLFRLQRSQAVSQVGSAPVPLNRGQGLSICPHLCTVLKREIPDPLQVLSHSAPAVITPTHGISSLCLQLKDLPHVIRTNLGTPNSAAVLMANVTSRMFKTIIPVLVSGFKPIVNP